MVLCTRIYGSTGEHAYRKRLLDRMTVGRNELSDGLVYFLEDSQQTMPAPECSIVLSIVDGCPPTAPTAVGDPPTANRRRLPSNRSNRRQ